jgi:hypothetical protein
MKKEFYPIVLLAAFFFSLIAFPLHAEAKILPPTFAWNTFQGESGTVYDDAGLAIVTDKSGNIYIAGQSAAEWGLLTPPIHAHSGGGAHDIFVLKLDSSGVHQWHTFFGANGNSDVATGIALDSDSNIYVTGRSFGTWNGGPGSCVTPGISPCPLQAFTGNSDIFVLKLDGAGAYQWHTFYGALSSFDFGNAIATDNNSNIYITGKSNATWNGPGSCVTPGTSPCPLNAYSGGYDLVALKLNSSGAYQWHTFFGGSGSNEAGNGVTTDSSGNVYLTGYTGSAWNGPGSCVTPGTPPCPLHVYTGGNDLLVLKLNGSGAYQWHTFYGSAGNDDGGSGIALDSSGNIYVAGYSMYNNWGDNPINDHSGGYYDIAVLKLSNDGAYLWNTFHGYGPGGGNPYYDTGSGIAVDGSGGVYITGYSSNSWNGPAPDSSAPRHTFSGTGANMFALKLNTSGIYEWHTFYNSDSSDSNGNAIALDSSRNIMVTGSSGASWGPPVDPYIGGYDIYVLKLAPGTCSGNPVKIEGKSEYATISAAYAAATNGESIQMQAADFDGDLSLAKSGTITLKGGYDCAFSGNSGWATFHGKMTISGGTIKIDTVALR